MNKVDQKTSTVKTIIIMDHVDMTKYKVKNIHDYLSSGLEKVQV